VKSLLFRSLAVAAVVAAVVVPAASAQSSAVKVKVSLLPLQKAQLGAAGKSLALQFDSGSVPNALAGGNSFSGAPATTFKKMGRITGYALDYGVGSSGGSSITEVYTQVDQYKTAAGAKKGLAFWKKDDPKLTELNQGTFAVTSRAHKVPAVGSRRFAYLASFSAPNLTPVWNVDEQFTDGRYELDVTVWAGNANAATKLVSLEAKKLDARLRKAVAGKLHAKLVKLPKLPPAGQAPGGPDLSALSLQPSDFTGTATVQAQGYVLDTPPLSTWDTFMEPAGQFDLLDQAILWWPTANEAAFDADWFTAENLAAGATSIDLASVGDGAQGVIDNESGGGFGQVMFSSGQLEESIVAISQAGIQASDVHNVAQAAANYINNAGLGS
jgi:hypothetical protein